MCKFNNVSRDGKILQFFCLSINCQSHVSSFHIIIFLCYDEQLKAKWQAHPSSFVFMVFAYNFLHSNETSNPYGIQIIYMSCENVLQSNLNVCIWAWSTQSIFLYMCGWTFTATLLMIYKIKKVFVHHSTDTLHVVIQTSSQKRVQSTGKAEKWWIKNAIEEV